MTNIGGLPNMGDKRLTSVQKKVHSCRKATTIANDKLRDSLTRYERCVDREKQSEDYRTRQEAVPVKRNLAHNRALQKCLRRRRLSANITQPFDVTSPRNGVYDGASLRSMRGEVSEVIAHASPLHRRQRKVEKLKKDGYREGRLVHYHDSLNKFDHLLNRPKIRITRPPLCHLHPRHSLMREHPLGLDLRSLSSYSYDDDTSDGDDVTLGARSVRTDDAGVLRLPAIQAARRKSRYDRSLPTTSTASPALPPIVRSAFGPY